MLFIFVPAVCLHNIVRERRLIWRLAFYQICGFTNLAFWGYIFAFTGIWPAWLLRVLLIILPIALKLILDRKRIFGPAVANLKELAGGTVGRNMLVKRFFQWLKEKLLRAFEMYFKHSFARVIVLAAITVFIVAYYGYFKLHYTTYSSSDEATHLYWVHALMTGQAFPVGLYPHLMHFIIAAISSLLNVSALYVNHYISVVMAVMIHFTLYCALASFLRSKTACIWGTGIFTITALFVTGGRYQMTLPMEFGFIPMLMVIIFLQGYMEKRERIDWWMLILSLFCTTQLHFTSVIFALFFVLAYLIVYAGRLFKVKAWLRTLAALGLALLLSIAPFGAGLIMGYPMEQSMGWAVSLFQNRDDYYVGNELAESSAAPEESGAQAEQREPTAIQKEWESVNDPGTFLNYILHLLTDDVASSKKAAALLYILEIFALGYGIFRLIYSRKKKERDYIIVAGVIWLIAFIAHAVPKAMGSTLADSGRMQIILSLVSAFIIAVPVQALSDLFLAIPKAKKQGENILLALSIAGLGLTFGLGNTKKPESLYYNFVIQSESFKLTDDLINNSVKDTWTVISPVNDLVGIRCYGYHYEIIDLLWEIEGGEEEFYIPTPDIYVTVEKKIPHFEAGETTFSLQTVRNGEDLILERSDEVDPDMRNVVFDDIGITAENIPYSAYYDKRLVTMSKLYYWMELVKKNYPGEVTVYSEDENCVIYHITQDPYFLLNLALDYRTEQ